MAVRNSKVTKFSSNPDPNAGKQVVYRCCYCGELFSENQRMRGFSKAQSPFYKGNERYFHICKQCVDELYEHYRRTLKSEEAALRRMCMHLDVYWNDEIYEMLGSVSSSRPLFRAYLDKAGLRKYNGKTYDDTLDEEAEAKSQISKSTQLPAQEDGVGIIDIETLPLSGTETEAIEVTTEDIDFWGDGFSVPQIRRLKYNFAKWTKDKGSLTVSQEALYKQICITELKIDLEFSNGDSTKISSLQSSLTNLMAKQNIAPNQNKENDMVEKNTYSVLLHKFEDRKAIKKPDPWMKNEIVRLVTVFFMGHLCKMFGLNNKYSKMYEDEMASYRVERPEYENDDDESVFEAVFSEGLRSVSGAQDSDDDG